MSTRQPNFAEQRADLLLSIEREQDDVRVALHELTDAAGDKLDAAAYIRSSPLAWTLGAFLVGAWLGTRAAPTRNGTGRRHP
ncbi:MAG: hypothetical protein ABR538_07020 [Candidatus Binatia bacterium]